MRLPQEHDDRPQQGRGDLPVAEVPIRDSYTHAYVMRALSILVRIAARDGKVKATARLAGFAHKMIGLKKAPGEFKMTEVWSKYYLPLGILQYKNEVEAAFKAAGG